LGGKDLSFQDEADWDTSYAYFSGIFGYINERQGEYNAEAEFGTVSDYFKVFAYISIFQQLYLTKPRR
jgi:hypothetical protein